MRTIRVQYTVRPEYIETNKANIKAVMEDLRNNPINGLAYSAFHVGDGQFMHLSISTDEGATNHLNQRESFSKFRSELKGSGPLSPPASVNPELVGSNFDFFQNVGEL